MDWRDWHRHYDDPDSGLSRRLRVVHDQIRNALDATDVGADRPLRVISFCAGDGRDVLPILAETGRSARTLLVEVDEELSRAARVRAADLGLEGVTVITGDAGTSTVYADHHPADLCLLCGVFGNISFDDIARTVRKLPMLLAPGARVIWTRGHNIEKSGIRPADDPSEFVRDVFGRTGYTELSFVRPEDASFRVGTNRWPGDTASYEPDTRFFQFR